MPREEIPQPYYGKMPAIPEELRHLPDRISSTLIGKTLFITGGSGFLGKILLEKIMRKTPGIEKIYLLLRCKKGKDGRQRLDELFNSPVFDKVKALHGAEITNKVSVIGGDMTTEELGISKEDKELLRENVEVVIHAAATIRFDEPLKKAVLLNTRGTKLMLDLTETFKKLELFVYISTAYCHLDQKILEEKPYPAAADPYKIIKSCELMDEELVDSVSTKILKGFPNSYAFTKNLSESLVVERINKGFPAIVLRPSIVIPTWLEPLPGWTDNINGPTGLLIGAGKGVIRTMYCDNTGYADYMPVDICANGVVVAMWNYLYLGARNPVYHLTSNSEWQVTWQQIIDLGKDIITHDIPLNNAVWYPGGSMKRSRLLHQICVVLFHMIPAYFLDTLIFLSGNKPVLLRVQDRINKGFEVFEYYANNQWYFKNDWAVKIRELMNDRERIEYKVDGEGMDLRKYFSDCILAARLYILKESPETIPSARRHMKMMYWVDVLTRIAFFGFLFYFFTSSFDSVKNVVTYFFMLITNLLSIFTKESTTITQSVRNDL